MAACGGGSVGGSCRTDRQSELENLSFNKEVLTEKGQCKV
jgi:hypothetical protein